MALYSQTIKNLVSGISQQPPLLRNPEQLEYQENGISSEVGGLQKRPPTLHINTLMPHYSHAVKPLVHIINRDEAEQYIVMFTGTEIFIWDMKGNSKKVKFKGGAASYIKTNTPRKNLKAITVADYTFVVNIDKKVSMAAETIPDVWATQGALINVKSGQYGREYSIIIDGIPSASFKTPDGSNAAHSTQIDTNYIAGKLKESLPPNIFKVEQGEGWIYITRTDGAKINTIDTKDGFNNQAMFGFLETTQRFSNLPATAPDGFTIKVEGEPGTNADDYYIKYNAADRIWKETAHPGISCAFDNTTLPHALVREADGTFTFMPVEWAKRQTGNDDSNPEPSFIGQKINDMFFFRNRLGFIAGENVILSKSGDFFQFWVSSAVELQDTDCIDIAVSHNTVSTLYHAVPFNQELLLFSAQTQFVLKADGVLTPRNASLNQLTEFGNTTWVRPVAAGRNIYFPAERAYFTSIREYYAVQDIADVKNAQDITSHIPSFIPNGVYKLLSSTIENFLLVLTEGDESKIYVYKYLYADERRIQSAWSFWQFDNGRILGGGFIGSKLYLLMQRGEELTLECMSFTYITVDFPDAEPYRVFMDRKKITPAIAASAYDDTANETIINFKDYFESVSDCQYGLVTRDGVFKDIHTPEIRLQGNYTGERLIVGQLYNWKVIFTELMIKKNTQYGLETYAEGRLQVKSFWVDYTESGAFKIVVEHFDKQKYEYLMTARTLGATNNYVGIIPIDSGKFKIPVQSASKNCRISAESNYPTPIALIGAGWDGAYHQRSKKI